MQGKIIRGIAGFYYVNIEQKGIIECKAKGIFRNRKEKPLVGDDVEIEILDEEKKAGNIITISSKKESFDPPGGCKCGSGSCDICIVLSETEFKPFGSFLAFHGTAGDSDDHLF